MGSAVLGVTINICFIGFGCLVIVLFRSHPAILLSVEGLVSIMFWVERSGVLSASCFVLGFWLCGLLV